MTKFFKVLMIFIFLTVLSGFGFSQVEFHFFGQYNMNMSYPADGTADTNVKSIFNSYYNQWQAFLGPVLEQKNNLGFGGRIAFNVSPSFAIEGTFEYIMAETQFNETVSQDITDLLTGLGYVDELTIVSGGSIMRYYGNVVFNIPAPGNITPYITAGAGITQFTLKKGNGPELCYLIKSGALTLAEINFWHENISVLTFNGGLGIKFKVSPNFGIRLDGRIFYCSPEINQFLNHTSLAIEVFNNKISHTTTGSHLDASFNFGFFIAL